MHATLLHNCPIRSSFHSSKFHSNFHNSSIPSSLTKRIPIRDNRGSQSNQAQMLACHFRQTGRNLAMAFRQLALSKVSHQCILHSSPANQILTMSLRLDKQVSHFLGVSRNQHVGQPVLRLTIFSQVAIKASGTSKPINFKTRRHRDRRECTKTWCSLLCALCFSVFPISDWDWTFSVCSRY